MSDVLGAYKILISAKPDQAVDAFKEILDAAKKTEPSFISLTSAITAFNQGLEIMSKVKDVFMYIAESAYAATGKIIDFVSAGGEYKEQRNQLENMANSYGIAGDTIIAVIDNISDHTLGLKDTMTLASVAINTGVGVEKLEPILIYAKKWSETMGGSFKDTAEAMINALQKGGGAALEKFGLTIDKAASSDEIIKKITDSLGKFGDTGFNAADKFTGIVNLTERFGLKAGEAVNNSETLANAISWLKDEVAEFVQGFDYSYISEFVDITVQGIEKIAAAFGIDFVAEFEKIKAGFAGTFSSGESDAKKMWAAILDYAEIFVLALAAVANAFTTIFPFKLAYEFFLEIGGWITSFLEYTYNGFRTLIGWLLEKVGGAIVNINTMLPNIPELLMGNWEKAFNGSGASQKLAEIGNTIKQMGANAGNLENPLIEGFAIEELFGANKEYNQMNISLGGVVEKFGDLKKSLNEMKPSVEVPKALANNLGAGAEEASKLGKGMEDVGSKSKDAAEDLKEMDQELKATQESMSKGTEAISKNIDSLLKAYSQIIMGDVTNPAAEMKIKVQLDEERTARDRMIQSLEELAEKANKYDIKKELEKILKQLKFNVNVYGDDILKKLFEKAIVYAKLENIQVAGV